MLHCTNCNCEGDVSKCKRERQCYLGEVSTVIVIGSAGRLTEHKYTREKTMNNVLMQVAVLLAALGTTASTFSATLI